MKSHSYLIYYRWYSADGSEGVGESVLSWENLIYDSDLKEIREMIKQDLDKKHKNIEKVIIINILRFPV